MILQLENVNSYYDKSHILFDMNLEVEEGHSVCLLGRNGVGKSTTMKSIMGLLNPKAHASTEGKIMSEAKISAGCRPTGSHRLGSHTCRKGGISFRR